MSKRQGHLADSSLLSLADCENLSIDETIAMYEKYINPGQAKIFSSFSFGRESFSHAEGMYLYTNHGKQILDLTGGFGVLGHGHNHPRILAARAAFLERKRVEVHKITFSRYLAALSQNVAMLLPGDLNKSFFCNSGAEAVEGALKVAYRNHQPPREYVMFADISFHGKLIGTGSISGSLKGTSVFPRIENRSRYTYGDLESVRKCEENLKDSEGNCNVYAIIVEPYNASSMIGASKRFLIGLRDFCDEHNIVLIFDEVYTGWGKCGSMFAFLESGVVPDVLTTSKTIGGGKSSIAAYIARDPIFDRAYGTLNDALLHTSTYNGFGEECITAIEAINIAVEENFPERARRIYKKLNTGLMALAEKFPVEIDHIRGKGAHNGVVLRPPFGALEGIVERIPIPAVKRNNTYIKKVTTASVVEQLYRKYNILAGISDNQEIMLVASPAMIASDAQLQNFLDALDAILSSGLKRSVTGFVKDHLIERMRLF